MNIALIYRDYSDILKGIEASLGSQIENAVFRHFQWTENGNIMSELFDLAPEILITENLAGFTMTTMMDSIAYNKLSAKQFHLLTDDSWNTTENLELLKKPLSLSMSFLCTNAEYDEILKRINPDIPYAKAINNNDYLNTIMNTCRL